MRKILMFTALALTACDGPPSLSDPNREASPIAYNTVGMILDGKMDGYELAEEALSDGKLTEGEYDSIIAVGDAADLAKYNAAKEELKNRFKGENHGDTTKPD